MKTDRIAMHCWRAWAVAAASAVGLAGCMEGSDRPLSFKPGVYQGERSPALTEEQRKALRERGNLQR
jgi:hypothetical protein